MERDFTKELMNKIAENAKAGKYTDTDVYISMLMVISRALVEIRDELRKMNEREDGNNGKT